MIIVEVREDYDVLVRLEINAGVIPSECMVILARFAGELADTTSRESRLAKRRVARRAKVEAK